MTKRGKIIRCYSPRVFAEQFCPNSPEIQQWVDYINTVGLETEASDGSVESG